DAVPCPAPRNLTTYMPSSSASTSAGSEPPSRSGVTYRVARTVRSTGRPYGAVPARPGSTAQRVAGRPFRPAVFTACTVSPRVPLGTGTACLAPAAAVAGTVAVRPDGHAVTRYDAGPAPEY